MWLMPCRVIWDNTDINLSLIFEGVFLSHPGMSDFGFLCSLLLADGL